MRSSLLLCSLTIFGGFSSLAVAQPAFITQPTTATSSFQGESLTPIEEIQAGNYTSTGGYFRGMEIKPWADMLIMNGYINYGGYFSRFTSTLQHTNANNFQGSGNLTVAYTDGSSCVYPIKIKIFAYSEGLYITSSQPNSVPTTSGECYSTGGEAEFIHSEPYILEEK